MTHNSDSEEGDIKISAQLKRWGEVNQNGEIYTEEAYEQFINDYYIKGNLNVPFTLMHGWGVENIIGRVDSMKSDEKGLSMTATIFGDCISTRVRTLIDRGVLQGVSDEGYGSFDYDDEKHVWIARKMQLMAVSLVTIPAEVAAGIEVKNTAFRGFERQEQKQTETRVKNLKCLRR